MKNNPKEKLLRDVLDDASGSFRQEILEASLKELRQTKGRARIRLGLPLAIAASLVLGVGLLFFNMPHRKNKQARAVPAGSLPTAPVSAYEPMEIVTSSGPRMAIVESRQNSSLIVENSNIRQPVEILGDSGLLALFPDKPAGLVADVEGTVTLVLLDSRDEMLRP